MIIRTYGWQKEMVARNLKAYTWLESLRILKQVFHKTIRPRFCDEGYNTKKRKNHSDQMSVTIFITRILCNS